MMFDKTRAQQAKDAKAAKEVDPRDFNVKVLSKEKIAKLYPGMKVDKRAWTPEHRDFMARRNMKARKKKDSSKKDLPSFEE